MVSLLSKKRSKESEILEIQLRALDAQYARMALKLEEFKNLARKIENIEKKLEELERVIRENGIRPESFTISAKTKEAIKLILQKHRQLTAKELGKLINLSRTRCNEYLKQMELEGVLSSKTIGRKKYYFLRQ